MKKLIILFLLLITVSFSQTSKWTQTFTNASGTAITTGLLEVVPYDSTYPAGALSMTHLGDGVWTVTAPDGEYKLYYDSTAVAKYPRFWIGENAISTFIDAIKVSGENKVDGAEIDTNTIPLANLKDGDYGDFAKSTTFSLDEYIVGSEQVKKSAVKEYNTAFITKGTNLFNKATANIGYLVNVTTGALSANASYVASDYIPVEQSTAYSFANAPKNLAWYDSLKVFISGSAATSPATSPATAYFMRITTGVSDTSTFQVAQGSSLPSYESYKEILTYSNYQDKDEKDVASGYAGLDTNSQISKTAVPFLSRTSNLFDKTTSTDGYYFQASLVANSGYAVSDYIPVSAGSTYTRSYVDPVYCTWFTSAKVYISNVTSPASVTAPANAAYARVSIRKEEFTVDEFQFSLGSSLPSYTEYGYEPEYDLLVQKTSNRDVADSLYGKKLIAIGNSITYGYIPRNSLDNDWSGQLDSYAKITADELNMTFVNYGISGSTLGYIDGTHNPMTRRYNSMVDDADIILVMGGTNDIRFGMPIGIMGDSTDVTFYGALDVMCNGLITKYIIANDMAGTTTNGQAADALNAQIDTVTLSGTKGDCYIRATGGLHKLVTFNTSLTQTATDFVADYTADYSAQGIDITSSGTKIIFTAQAVNTAFDSPVVLGGKAKGTDKQIVFLTPLKNGTDWPHDYSGSTLVDFANAVKEVCAYYSIPVFDAQNESLLNPHINLTIQGWQDGYTDLYNALMPDATHPSAEGHQILAKRLIGFLKQLR